MSHNKMSGHALKLLTAGLADNTVLTDFFFTHNDLSETPDESMTFIKSMANKQHLTTLAFNSCNLNGDLLEELKNSIVNHCQLRELYLFANKIDQSGAPHIAHMIANKLQL